MMGTLVTQRARRVRIREQHADLLNFRTKTRISLPTTGIIPPGAGIIELTAKVLLPSERRPGLATANLFTIVKIQPR